MQTTLSVDAHLDANIDPARSADCETLISMLRAATSEPPCMWRPGIVGFASRKQDLTLYLKRLADVDLDVLDTLIKLSVAEMRRRHS